MEKKEFNLLCIFLPHTVEIRTASFVPAWLYGKPPWRHLCVQPFPHSLEKTQPHTKHYAASTFSISLKLLDVISKSQLGARLPEGSRQALQGHQDWQNCSRSAHDLEMQREETDGCTYCTQLRASLESPECREGNYLKQRLFQQSHFYHVVIFAVSLELQNCHSTRNLGALLMGFSLLTDT